MPKEKKEKKAWKDMTRGEKAVRVVVFVLGVPVAALGLNAFFALLISTITRQVVFDDNFLTRAGLLRFFTPLIMVVTIALVALIAYVVYAKLRAWGSANKLVSPDAKHQKQMEKQEKLLSVWFAGLVVFTPLSFLANFLDFGKLAAGLVGLSILTTIAVAVYSSAWVYERMQTQGQKQAAKHGEKFWLLRILSVLFVILPLLPLVGVLAGHLGMWPTVALEGAMIVMGAVFAALTALIVPIVAAVKGGKGARIGAVSFVIAMVVSVVLLERLTEFFTHTFPVLDIVRELVDIVGQPALIATLAFSVIAAVVFTVAAVRLYDNLKEQKSPALPLDNESQPAIRGTHERVANGNLGGSKPGFQPDSVSSSSSSSSASSSSSSLSYVPSSGGPPVQMSPGLE